MSPEDFQIDGDIKMSALLLMKKKFFFFFLRIVLSSMSTWAVYPGKSYTCQKLLPQVTWFWDREEWLLLLLSRFSRV